MANGGDVIFNFKGDDKQLQKTTIVRHLTYMVLHMSNNPWKLNAKYKPSDKN